MWQNATIGPNDIWVVLRVIGNNVIVGPHVYIIGNVKIRDNVISEVRSIVVIDLSDNVIVAGNLDKIIKKYDKEKMSMKE